MDTNNTLERQNFAIKVAAGTAATFGSDPIGLLVAVALGIFPAQSWAQAKAAGKATVAGKATAAKDSKTVIDADAPVVLKHHRPCQAVALVVTT